MEPRPLKFFAEACGGEVRGGSPEVMVQRVCTDSRQVQPGDLFVALAGERFDAHDFLDDVAAKGAAAILAEQQKLSRDFPACPVIAVPGSRRALGELAACYRSDFSLPMIAVGGSNGKTTTKELIASVLRQNGPALWSEASFNNDIGVPLTLLKLRCEHKTAVLEVGTNHPGELAPLMQMISPRYSVITSIGREHLEFFGDMAGVVEEEGTLAELLPAQGTLFINAESEWSDAIARRTKANVVRVGWTEDNDFRAHNVRLHETGVTFLVSARRAEFEGEYRIHLLGRHQVLNALLAIAAGAELGLAREQIERGLAECRPAKMRMQVWSANGVQVLDDAYNANADSMLAALQTLKDFPCNGRRVAVLGDMAELGTYTATAHTEVGRKAGELRVDRLFAVGKNAVQTAGGARDAGLASVSEHSDIEDVAKVVQQFLRPGDVLLLKASRSVRLERLGDFLRGAKAT